MRRLLTILFILVALPVSLLAQQFKGRISDAGNGQPVAMALIRNLRTGSMWLSDSLGNCAFSAQAGDWLRIEHTAYNDYTLKIQSQEDLIYIRLEKAPIMLQGVEVLSPYKRFSEDSVFMREYFHKELGYSGSQVKMDMNGGIGTSGLISELALVLSGRKKRAKQFADDLLMLESWRYEGIRYTVALVTSQTGLNDSAAQIFIANHPMPMDLLRGGSELALKMWVRDEFRASIPANPINSNELSGTFRKERTDSLAELR